MSPPRGSSRAKIPYLLALGNEITAWPVKRSCAHSLHLISAFSPPAPYAWVSVRRRRKSKRHGRAKERGGASGGAPSAGTSQFAALLGRGRGVRRAAAATGRGARPKRGAGGPGHWAHLRLLGAGAIGAWRIQRRSPAAAARGVPAAAARRSLGRRHMARGAHDGSSARALLGGRHVRSVRACLSTTAAQSRCVRASWLHRRPLACSRRRPRPPAPPSPVLLLTMAIS